MPAAHKPLSAASPPLPPFKHSVLKGGSKGSSIHYNASITLCADGNVLYLTAAKFFQKVEGGEESPVHFAVNCRHCESPVCVTGCIAGALSKISEGMVAIDQDKCVGCYTCVLLCPYGAIMPAANGKVAQKCMLCTDNANTTPNCVAHCPNNAIVYEER